MVEQFLRQSPLAHLGLEGREAAEQEGAGIRLSERPFPAIVDLRGAHKDLAPVLKSEMGFSLPKDGGGVAKHKSLLILWLGPDRWWLADESAELLADQVSQTVASLPHAATNVGESRTVIRVSGPRAADLLAKGCPLDFHDSVFPEGSCAQSLMAKAGVLIHRLEKGEGYDLYVLRSFADYLWHWLSDASQEYGLAVSAN